MKQIELTIREVNLLVEYDFEKGDDGVRYYPDGTGYPPTSDTVDIIKIMVDDVDIYDLIDDGCIEDIEDAIIFEENNL
ncbi:MAG: hypothetical protein HRU18_11210 [Pseudoalteromonas sp.]|uniref:hypothetical protein n=1 Tax=Pseudoalteromonas sp. TaxID=53249 RepID=UPI001D3A8E47|nr:hypothetical protein [Pseudoalteromonas sp.]NRA78768.1 hypothetical protein [Pseudoalteromonas sp.]